MMLWTLILIQSYNMENKPPVPSNYQGLWTSRLILLVETGPQTNLYRQIMLNQRQFKIISDALSVAFGPMAGMPNAIPFQVDDEEIIKLPSEIQNWMIPKNS